MNASRDIYFLARERAFELAVDIFGEPNKNLSTSTETRFGSHGSIKVTVAGEYSGFVSDWSRDIHGDISQFIMTEYGFSAAETAQYLKERLGCHGGPVLRMPMPTRAALSTAHAKTVENARAAAKREWEGGTAFRDSPGHEYLCARFAGVDVPETVISSGQLRWSDSTIPGAIGSLLGRMHDPVTGDSTGVHRTFVNEQMQKIGVGLLGRRGAIKLYGDSEAGTLLLAEGLETAISASILFGHPKVMAAGSAGALASFPVIDDLSLVVCGDNDPPDKRGRCPGQSAMVECADRWRLAGRKVTTKLPCKAGEDFNDLLVSIANEI